MISAIASIPDFFECVVEGFLQCCQYLVVLAMVVCIVAILIVSFPLWVPLWYVGKRSKAHRDAIKTPPPATYAYYGMLSNKAMKAAVDKIFEHENSLYRAAQDASEDEVDENEFAYFMADCRWAMMRLIKGYA